MDAALHGDLGAILECTGNGHRKDEDRDPHDGNVGLIRFNPLIYRGILVNPGRVACQDISMMSPAHAAENL